MLQHVEMEVRDHWKSPNTGVRYPSRWHVLIPDEGLELDILPYLTDQELDVSVHYWEGAVTVSGTTYDAPITGSGYVELVGYNKPINE